MNKLRSSKASLSQSKSNLIQSNKALSNIPRVDSGKMESFDKSKGQNDSNKNPVEGNDGISAALSPSSNNRMESNSGLLNQDILAAKESIVGNYYVPPSRL